MVFYVNEGSVYAISIIFPILCTAAVILRFQARRKAEISYGIDDWTAVGALVCTIGCAVVLIIGDTTHTVGWHSDNDLPTDPRVVLNSKLQVAFYQLFFVAAGLIRLALLLFYRRIFGFTAFSVINWVVIVLNICWVITYFVGSLSECGVHISVCIGLIIGMTGSLLTCTKALWQGEGGTLQYCQERLPFAASWAIADAVLDFIVFVLPIVPVSQLRMSLTQKLLLLVVFSLGLVPVAASIVKMVFAIKFLSFDPARPSKLFGLDANTDAIGVLGAQMWWTVCRIQALDTGPKLTMTARQYLEIGVGCIVCNAPPTIGILPKFDIYRPTSDQDRSQIRARGMTMDTADETIDDKIRSESV